MCLCLHVHSSMCTCVYVLHIFMFVYMCKYMCMWDYACMCVFILYMYAFMCKYVCVHVCIGVRVCVYAYVYVCMYVCVSVYICVFVYAYIFRSKSILQNDLSMSLIKILYQEPHTNTAVLRCWGNMAHITMCTQLWDFLCMSPSFYPKWCAELLVSFATVFLRVTRT